MTKEHLTALEKVNELRLTECEEASVSKTFEKMEAFEQRMGLIDTENVEEMIFVMPLTNVLREDARHQDFPREDLLKGAPDRTEDSWQVPQVL